MIIESDTFKMNCPDDGIVSARKILKPPIVAVNAKRIRPVFVCFPTQVIFWSSKVHLGISLTMKINAIDIKINASKNAKGTSDFIAIRA